MFAKVYNLLLKAIEVFAAIGIILIVLFTSYEVIMREILGSPTIWTNEITSYLLVWFGIISIVYAYDREAHISVDIVYRHLGTSKQIMANILTSFLMCGFSIAVFYYGYKYSWMAYTRGWSHTGSINIPMIYTRSALPFIGILLVIQTMMSLSKSIMLFIHNLKNKST